jgi:hypothetical protein
MEKFGKALMRLGIGALIVIAGMVCANCIQFKIDCKGHLKLAADANSIELAKRELKTAIDYAEANNLTSGYTSIWFKVPTDNLEFWFNNLQSAYNELCELPENVTPLEKTNVLMKLCETLTDEGDKGTVVTVPDGIYVYPNNKAYAYWSIAFALIILLGSFIYVENY